MVEKSLVGRLGTVL